MNKSKENRVQASREVIGETIQMAWPAVCESFFVALAGLVDSLMVSSIGSYAVAAVGLTTQPKFMGLALFLAVNVSLSALVARRRGENCCSYKTLSDEELVKKERFSFQDFLYILKRLRAPDGCPWDRAQTHGSIRINMIEEGLASIRPRSTRRLSP